MCVPQTWDKIGCTARKLCSLLGASRDSGVMRERVVDLAVLRSNGESGGDFRFEIPILEIEHRRSQCMRVGRTRVDLQRLIDLRCCFFKMAGLERRRSFECECLDEVGIDRKRAGQR